MLRIRTRTYRDQGADQIRSNRIFELDTFRFHVRRIQLRRSQNIDDLRERWRAKTKLVPTHHRYQPKAIDG